MALEFGRNKTRKRDFKLGSWCCAMLKEQFRAMLLALTGPCRSKGLEDVFGLPPNITYSQVNAV
jgi:hypothetical protein